VIHMISYDLHKPEKNYEKLEEAILSLGSAIRPLYSLWFVETQLSTREARDYLKKFIDTDDRILVMRASKDWATMRIDKTYTGWLKVLIAEPTLTK
jgi:predicted NAD/FAD-dependent oxidoreductase